MEGFMELYFETSQLLAEYRRGVEEHVVLLRKAIQVFDHKAPHVYDGAGWSAYLGSLPDVND